MNKLIAFHGKEETKLFYIDRVKAHAEADQIVKGQYWENGKGCAVGCTIHSNDHNAYESELGIPQWLAHLEDRIFEGLPNELAMKWPLQFLDAINIGADLNKIKMPMLIFIVESAREKTKNQISLDAIDAVLIELKKDVFDLDKLRMARIAADAAAAYAAAAADDAYAAYAADAAAAAAYAADAAAHAAAAAADAAYAADAAAHAAAADDAYAAYAAEQKEHVKFADKLIKLIRGCKG